MKQTIFNKYATKVSEAYEISTEQLFTKSKRRDIVDARQLLYFVCADRPMRVRYIQQYMENKGYDVGHSSIIHGIGQVKERLEQDVDYQNFVDSIRSCVIL
jgi:chromosomal replication initiation ATPase DnaA